MYHTNTYTYQDVAEGCIYNQPDSRKQAQSLLSEQKIECDYEHGSTVQSLHNLLRSHFYPRLFVCNASLGGKKNQRISEKRLNLHKLAHITFLHIAR